MPDVIYIVEWPRSGGTWWMSYMADCLGFEVVGDYDGQEGSGFLLRVHNFPVRGTHYHCPISALGFAYEMLPEVKVILLARDPRDAIVSAYYMILRHDDHFEYDSFTLKDYMEQIFLVDDPPWYAGLPDPAPVDWRRFYAEWLDLYPSVVKAVARHEDIMKDRVGETDRVLRLLGYDVPREILEDRVHRYEGISRSTYDRDFARDCPTGEPVPSGSSRWRYHFHDDALQLMMGYWRYARDILRRLGYGWYMATRMGIDRYVQEDSGVPTGDREQCKVPGVSKPTLARLRRRFWRDRRRYGTTTRGRAC